MLCIVIVVKDFQRLATLLGHEGPFRSYKDVFLNDAKCRKIDFWPFFGLRLVGPT